MNAGAALPACAGVVAQRDQSDSEGDKAILNFALDLEGYIDRPAHGHVAARFPCTVQEHHDWAALERIGPLQAPHHPQLVPVPVADLVGSRDHRVEVVGDVDHSAR